MSIVVAVLIMLLLAGVLLLVTAPLRRPVRAPGPPAPGEDVAAPERDEPSVAGLESERQAKYREIRDAELDFRTGKLSGEDYRMLDAELRREALEILDRLEQARARRPQRR